jgi:hypothetical protein
LGYEVEISKMAMRKKKARRQRNAAMMYILICARRSRHKHKFPQMPFWLQGKTEEHEIDVVDFERQKNRQTYGVCSCILGYEVEISKPVTKEKKAPATRRCLSHLRNEGSSNMY